MSPRTKVKADPWRAEVRKGWQLVVQNPLFAVYHCWLYAAEEGELSADTWAVVRVPKASMARVSSSRPSP